MTWLRKYQTFSGAELVFPRLPASHTLDQPLNLTISGRNKNYPSTFKYPGTFKDRSYLPSSAPDSPFPLYLLNTVQIIPMFRKWLKRKGQDLIAEKLKLSKVPLLTERALALIEDPAGYGFSSETELLEVLTTFAASWVKLRWVRWYNEREGDEMDELFTSLNAFLTTGILKNMPKDVQRFIDSAISGDFYSVVFPNLNRNLAKRYTYFILFSDNKGRGQGKEEFERRFPNLLHDVIYPLKRPNKKVLSFFLQWLEATIVVHGVCGKLEALGIPVQPLKRSDTSATRS